MERHILTFEESVQRHCSLRLTNCGGPTSHGLDGYVCENCLAYIVAKFAADQGLSKVHCNYCGKSPTFAVAHGAPICETCAQQGLKAARHWYNLRGEGTNA